MISIEFEFAELKKLGCSEEEIEYILRLRQRKSDAEKMIK
jgi:hypothetical protein